MGRFKWLRKFWNPFSIQNEIDELTHQTTVYYSKLREIAEQSSKDNFSCRYAVGVNTALSTATKCLIWTKNTDGRIITLNDPMKKQLFTLDIDLTWITDRELVKCYEDKFKDLEQASPTSLIRDCLVNDAHVLETGKTTCKLARGTFYGKDTILRIRKNVIRDIEGTIIGVIGISDDITEKIAVLETAIKDIDDESIKLRLIQQLEVYTTEV